MIHSQFLTTVLHCSSPSRPALQTSVWMAAPTTLGSDYVGPRAGETYDMVISELPPQVEMKEDGGGDG